MNSPMKRETMKEKIYNYLLEALHSLPSCDTCHYNYTSHLKRVPCNKCEGWSKYKMHKGYKADLERMVRGIIKIVKTKK